MEPSAAPQTPGTELRIALGMRGGVSLAVWMGGACSEVDRLRRARDRNRPEDQVYRWLLDCAGYSRVAVDVLAGASAGGLNGVLMSCSVIHGMEFGSNIRNLWLQVGDLGSLVRKDGSRMPASLLDGDRNFYGTLSRELPDLVAKGEDRPSRPPRLDTILTCTLLTPATRRRFQDLGPPIDERRNRAWFRFRSPGPAGEGSDFGAPGSDLTDPLRRLAYAARATSSFPGAFEPASVGYAEDSPLPVGDGRAVLPPASHYGIYSESRRRPNGGDPGRDHVIDGGVLDNIPLAWAVRAIAAAPANCQVDRWLLYLQPVPFPPVAGGGPEQPRTFDTVHRARDLKGSTEALADDLDELQRLRRDGQRRRGFAQVLEYALGQLPTGTTVLRYLGALAERGLAARDRYRERAGEMEAGRIRELWTDPLAVLGADPLGFRRTTRDALPERNAGMLDLLPQVGPDLVLDEPSSQLPGAVSSTGDATQEPTDEEKDALARAAIATMAGELDCFRSPQVLARTVSVLLDASRELGPFGLKVKERLYDVRAAIEVLIAEADRALAAAGSVAQPPETREQLLDLVQATLPAGGRDRWSDVWDDLVSAARDVAVAAQAAAAATTAPPDERAFLGCLVKAADWSENPDRATRAVLAVVELLTGPLRPDPLAETTPVKFHMISAVNKSPVVRDAEGNPAAAGKLAGNQLRNFGAFLSAKWRLNDWTWGRLDGSSSLVDVLLRRFDQDDPTETETDRAARLAREADLRDALGLTPGCARDDVRDACVTRLHRDVLRWELPLFTTVEDRPPTKEQLEVDPIPATETPDPEALLETGQEGVLDVVRRGRDRISDLTALLGVGAVVAADGTLQSARNRFRSWSRVLTGGG